MKLDDKQKAALTFAAEEYRAFRSTAASIDAELAMEKERRLSEARVHAQRAFQRCLDLEVPRRQIHLKAMGVKDRLTLARFMESAPTADEVDADGAPLLPDASDAASIYERQDGAGHVTVTVRLNHARHREAFDVARAGSVFRFDWEEAVSDPELRIATFDRNGDPITPDWMPERLDRHPLVVLYTTVPELRAELIGEAA